MADEIGQRFADSGHPRNLTTIHPRSFCKLPLKPVVTATISMLELARIAGPHIHMCEEITNVLNGTHPCWNTLLRASPQQPVALLPVHEFTLMGVNDLALDVQPGPAGARGARQRMAQLIVRFMVEKTIRWQDLECAGSDWRSVASAHDTDASSRASSAGRKLPTTSDR